MPDLLIFLAAASCLIWFWLLLFHDNFWRADQKLANTTEALRDWENFEDGTPQTLLGRQGKTGELSYG